MMILLIILGFLLPVMLVFAYSVWLNRQRRSSAVIEISGDSENKTYSALVQRCKVLRNSAITDDGTGIEEDIVSILEIARSLQEQNLRELSLSHVMGVYVAIGREDKARALLSEVKEETNRATILEKVFGNAT